MSSARPGATHRKPTRRAGRKAPTLRPESNTSVTAGEWVVNQMKSRDHMLFSYIARALVHSVVSV